MYRLLLAFVCVGALALMLYGIARAMQPMPIVPTASATTSQPTATSQPATNAACMHLVLAQGVPLGSHKADWVANYAGCQQVYAANGTLVGYGIGTGLCNQLAYTLTFTYRLQGKALHARMGGICVLYDDWAWGAE